MDKDTLEAVLAVVKEHYEVNEERLREYAENGGDTHYLYGKKSAYGFVILTLQEMIKKESGPRCVFCDKPMVVNADGTSNHLVGKSAIEEIDYEQDADHTAVDHYVK